MSGFTARVLKSGRTEIHKRNLGLRRLRLRGLTGAKDEFLLAATVQNLKKLVRLCASGPPIATKCAA
jgi:hypothetical protein